MSFFDIPSAGVLAVITGDMASQRLSIEPAPFLANLKSTLQVDPVVRFETASGEQAQVGSGSSSAGQANSSKHVSYKY